MTLEEVEVVLRSIRLAANITKTKPQKLVSSHVAFSSVLDL